jgi:hypothetical protein
LKGEPCSQTGLWLPSTHLRTSHPKRRISKNGHYGR